MVQVNVAHTSSQPSFVMPYTDALQDVDVSKQMLHEKIVERGLTQVCVPLFAMNLREWSKYDTAGPIMCPSLPPPPSLAQIP